MVEESPARELGRRALEASGAGRMEDATVLWEEALALDPRDTDVAIGFTNALTQTGDAQRAAHVCARLLEAHPDLAVLWLQQGLLLYYHLGDAEGAITSMGEALRLDPGWSLGHRLLAEICFLTFRLELMRHHAGLALTGTDPKIDLTIRTRYLSDYWGGVDLAQQILARTPDDVDAVVALAKCLRMLGRPQEALAHIARAAELAPENTDIAGEFGGLLLLCGEAERGWRQMETWASDTHVARHYPLIAEHIPRRWRGEPLAGKRIVVAYCAGIGDNLMMARYARDLRAAGAYVVFACRPELFRLVRGLEGADEVTDTWEIPRWGEFDHWVFDFLLPAYLGAPTGRIPAYRGGYLTVPDDIASHWDERVGTSRGGLRVGLCWFSGIKNISGIDWFVPAEALAPLAEMKGVDWFVMQRCADNPKIKTVLSENLHDHSDVWYDFADSAAIMRRLDLVISIDSAPLHLAGALGVRTWALIPAAPDWRWGLTGEESPWYPDVRIFRQARVGDWGDVITRIKAELTALMADQARSGPPLSRSWSQ